jgi:hypothetical protein
LGDVEEDSCRQSSFVKALRYFVDNPMCLLDRGVAGAKSELLTRNEEGEVHIRQEALQEESLEDLRRNREQANRAIGCYVMDRLTGFRHHYYLCEFSY